MAGHIPRPENKQREGGKDHQLIDEVNDNVKFPPIKEARDPFLELF